MFALAYLSKLGPALEGYRRENRGSGAHPVIQFRQLITTPESVRLSVLGAAPPNLKHEPFLVNMNIFLDEETMSLKMKLDFGKFFSKSSVFSRNEKFLKNFEFLRRERNI